MNAQERYNDLENTFRAVLDGYASGLWTALPCIISSFDADAVTVQCQPSIMGIITAPDGTKSNVQLPLLLDVPVCFPRGGNCTLTFPIKAGDECLVVFSTRCIDGWWQSGQVSPQYEPRQFDLSDGFAIVGPFSQKTKIGGISGSSVQLRSNDGQAYVQLNPTTHEIDTITPAKVTIQAGGDVDVTTQANCNITVTGNTTIATSGSTQINTSGTTLIQSGGSATIEAPSVTIEAATTTCTGALIVEGLFTYEAGMAGSGGTGGASANIAGNVNVTGGNVTADGIDLKTHVHGGVQSGSSNTGGPTG